MFLKTIRICIYDQGLFTVRDVLIDTMVDEFTTLNGGQLLPQIIEGRPFTRPEEIMNTAIINISFAFPGGAQSTGQVVHLEDR